jgi:hypothetical protein
MYIVHQQSDNNYNITVCMIESKRVFFSFILPKPVGIILFHFLQCTSPSPIPPNQHHKSNRSREVGGNWKLLTIKLKRSELTAQKETIPPPHSTSLYTKEIPLKITNNGFRNFCVKTQLYLRSPVTA